ncbi:MAG: hypothetical protein FJZ79_08285 [Chlorobi bacterium]|nr:hypothetical protein [Chlorobiota bacterium]
MSKSLLACAIGNEESSLVRIKTSGSGGYIVTACRTLALGSKGLEGKKQSVVLKKMLSLTDEWRGDALAICCCPDSYLPLNAYFPGDAPAETCAEQCRIEAAHFLTRPGEYLHDHAAYTVSGTRDLLEKHLVLFYRAEPFKTLAEKFAERHPLHFFGSPLLPTVHRSVSTGETTVFLDLEKSHVVLIAAKNGRLEYFNCRRITERKEAEYFAIHELQGSQATRRSVITVSGKLADKAMTALLEKETSCRLATSSIPERVEVAGRERRGCRSATAAKAISTALMTLEN